jgi:hypothetical protein
MIDLHEENIKVPDLIARYVEYELFAYRTYKIAVAELKKDLEDMKNHSRQFEPSLASSKHQTPGGPVSVTALRTIFTEEKLKQHLSRIRKIEAGMQLLSSEVKALVEKNTFPGWSTPTKRSSSNFG